MLRSRITHVVTFCVGVAVGAALTWAMLRPSTPTTWFEVKTNGQTLLSDEVFLADIPVADVVALRGRARFIDHDPGSSGGVGIGYFLDLELSRIDPSKIPKKYSVSKPVPGSKLTEPPIKVPYYTIQFTIRLLDEDDFLVAELKGAEHHVDSGKVNKLTGQTNPELPRAKALLVRGVAVETHFIRTPGARSD